MDYEGLLLIWQRYPLLEGHGLESLHPSFQSPSGTDTRRTDAGRPALARGLLWCAVRLSD
jgi:hypothetical protein